MHVPLPEVCKVWDFSPVPSLFARTIGTDFHSEDLKQTSGLFPNCFTRAYIY